MRLNSGGQWTIAESKFESSLCIEINRRFPFPLFFLIPTCSDSVLHVYLAGLLSASVVQYLSNRETLHRVIYVTSHNVALKMAAIDIELHIGQNL